VDLGSRLLRRHHAAFSIPMASQHQAFPHTRMLIQHFSSCASPCSLWAVVEWRRRGRPIIAFLLCDLRADHWVTRKDSQLALIWASCTVYRYVYGPHLTPPIDIIAPIVIRWTHRWIRFCLNLIIGHPLPDFANIVKSNGFASPGSCLSPAFSLGLFKTRAELTHLEIHCPLANLLCYR